MILGQVMISKILFIYLIDDVKNYLISEFSAILENPELQEAVLGNLSYDTQKERFDMIIGKLKKIVK